MTIHEWYDWHQCTHAHCPQGCDHPQPFLWADKLLCGRCYFTEGVYTEMIPCRDEEHCDHQ